MTSKCIAVIIMTFMIIEEIKGCYTQWGSRGRCVNIKKCDRLLNLLKRRPLLPTVLTVLRLAQCGFEGFDPKVCCGTRDDGAIGSSTLRPDISSINIDIQTTAKTTTTTTTTTTPTTPTAPPILIPVYDHPNRRLLDENQCGPIPEGRIYGGNVTSIHEFPWMALLGYDVGSDTIEFRCGGSIISKRYVLTAAHCISPLSEDLKLTNVRIGDHDLSTERDCDSWENGVGYNCAAMHQDFGIDRVHVHPDFERRKLHNDIALVRIDKEADFRPPSVRPICLPLGNAIHANTKEFVVTGWGSTEFGVRSQRLLKVNLPIVDVKKCNEVYGRQMIKICDKQICAGGTNKMDSCSGDSGGPLQAVGIFNGKPRNVIYGIVSFGPHSCGIEGFPGVYTKVAYYVSWILDTITD